MTTQRLWIALLFILLYIGLDFASYIHPLHQLNITPWNPAPALGLLLLRRWGKAALLPLLIALLLAEGWVRGLPAGLPWSLLAFILLTLGYGSLNALLQHYLPEGNLLSQRRLWYWVGIITLGSLGNGISFITALAISGLVPWESWSTTLVRFWIGDAVGIMLSLPLLSCISDAVARQRLAQCLRQLETWLYLTLCGGMLWLAFGTEWQSGNQYFYLLFLPLVWASSRQGLSGALLSASAIQLGIILAVPLFSLTAITVLELQLLALSVTLVGLFIGVTLDELQRTSAELQLSLRLAAAGEMAAALAHELNQPLTAVSVYSDVCRQLLARADYGTALQHSVQQLQNEAQRASAIVRRLRDFFRTGAVQLQPFSMAECFTSVSAAFQTLAATQQVQFTLQLPAPELILVADRLQIEIVIRNLLSNAFEAVTSSAAPHPRLVTLRATLETPHSVLIQVSDNGPGVDEALLQRVFEPFVSNKASGLGLGLAISRAIAEAHAGSLQLEHGNCFTLRLPLHESTSRHV